MIDWNRVTELQGEIGPDDFAEVVALFLFEVEGALARLSTADPHLGEQLHFLRGSAGNLGFQEFGAICQSGEHLCADGHRATVDLTAIHAVYAASKQVFLTGAHHHLLAV